MQISGIDDSLAEVAHGADMFVAVGDDGTVLSSPDGVIFSLRDAETRRDLDGVGFGDGQFVAVGRNAVIRNSLDGIDWF